jgi:hypothetical protein
MSGVKTMEKNNYIAVVINPGRTYYGINLENIIKELSNWSPGIVLENNKTIYYIDNSFRLHITMDGKVKAFRELKESDNVNKCIIDLLEWVILKVIRLFEVMQQSISFSSINIILPDTAINLKEFQANSVEIFPKLFGTGFVLDTILLQDGRLCINISFDYNPKQIFPNLFKNGVNKLEWQISYS